MVGEHNLIMIIIILLGAIIKNLQIHGEIVMHRNLEIIIKQIKIAINNNNHHGGTIMIVPIIINKLLVGEIQMQLQEMIHGAQNNKSQQKLRSNQHGELLLLMNQK